MASCGVAISCGAWRERKYPHEYIQVPSIIITNGVWLW